MFKSRKITWLAVGCTLGAIVVTCWYCLPFALADPDCPWVVELGRGSGLSGLDTVKVFDNGVVILTRNTRRGRENASIRLSKQALLRLIGSMERNRLMQLDRNYLGNVVDGTQWVLRINHADSAKSFYFDNHFPEPVVHFAEEVDAILAGNGLNESSWFLPAQEPREHETELWESIR